MFSTKPISVSSFVVEAESPPVAALKHYELVSPVNHRVLAVVAATPGDAVELASESSPTCFPGGVALRIFCCDHAIERTAGVVGWEDREKLSATCFNLGSRSWFF